MLPIVNGYSSSEDEQEELFHKPQVTKIVDVAPGKAEISNKTPTTIITTTTNHINNEIIDDLTFEKEIRKQRESNNHQKYKRKKRSSPWDTFSESEEEAHHGSEKDEEEEEKEEVEDAEQQQASESEEEEEETTHLYVRPEQLDSLLQPVDKLIKECFVPKKLKRVLEGHEKGTTKLEVINSVLLSGGNDSIIKLWSLKNNYSLIRSYTDHNKPVTDVNFSKDGKQFLSCSYDKTVKLWDTKSGEILMTLSLKSVPNCIKFINNEEFLVGLNNNNVEHYNKDKELIQTYSAHLSSINSITLLPNNKFVSSSIDKTLKIWEIGVNIPIKLISDTSYHSMPIIKLHPSNTSFAAQSLDNSIMVFNANTYKLNRNKTFSGHNIAGYSIDIDFSPDGKELISGDSFGNLIIWDWKNGKLIKKIKINDKPISKVVWDQNSVSRVIMSGNFGKIYIYD